jgi:hypothetical protein
VVNPDERRHHLQRFAAAGFDPTAAQQSGKFQLRTNTETYLRDGRFDQDRILEVFEQLASGNAKDRRQRMTMHREPDREADGVSE